MRSRSLAAALKDFGAPQLAAAEAFAAPAADFPEGPEFDPPTADLPVVEQVDTEALIAEAVASAEAVLEERLAQEHADTLQLERDRHAEELAEFQQRFAEEACEKIATAIEEMESRIVALTSAVAARILGGILTEELRDRSIARLAAHIRDALADGEAARIRIRGSQPLYEALKAKLPGHAEQFDFAEGVGFDLSVTIDDSIFETRLAEWSSALAEALA